MGKKLTQDLVDSLLSEEERNEEQPSNARLEKKVKRRIFKDLELGENDPATFVEMLKKLHMQFPHMEPTAIQAIINTFFYNYRKSVIQAINNHMPVPGMTIPHIGEFKFESRIYMSGRTRFRFALRVDKIFNKEINHAIKEAKRKAVVNLDRERLSAYYRGRKPAETDPSPQEAEAAGETLLSEEQGEV